MAMEFKNDLCVNMTEFTNMISVMNNRPNATYGKSLLNLVVSLNIENMVKKEKPVHSWSAMSYQHQPRHFAKSGLIVFIKMSQEMEEPDSIFL